MRRGDKLRGAGFARRAIQRIGRRHDADQDQHDEAHALLAVVGAVKERHQRAGEDQEAADPPGRRGVRLRRLIEFGRPDHGLHDQQKQRGEDEAEHRRHQQRLADFRHLVPVNAGSAVLSANERVGDADANDRSDQRMRARRRQAKPPGAEIPDDCGDEQREHHRIAGAGADLENELDRQQRHDAEGDGSARSEHAEEVPAARPHDRDLSRQGVGVDHCRDGVGGIVKAVDELESKRNQHRHAEQKERHNRGRAAAGLRDVGANRVGHVEEPARENSEKNQRKPDIEGLVQMRLHRRPAGAGKPGVQIGCGGHGVRLPRRIGALSIAARRMTANVKAGPDVGRDSA